MIVLISIFVVLIGLSVGSFLNVVIFRMRSEKGMVFSRSACRLCGKEIKKYDLVPILSYLILGGKCRHCRNSISIQYPLVEGVTALLFLVIFFLKGQEFYHTFSASSLFPVVVYWVYTSFLILIFVYDLKYYEIKNSVIFFGSLFVIIFALVFNVEHILYMVLGSMIFGFFMLFIFTISGARWIGGGDVKCAFLIGLMLGFPQILVAFFIMYVGGALVAIVLMILGQKKMGDKIPFGTFMALGAFLSFLFADTMIQWYQNLLGL